jgi:exodeoxyribonuclease VII small subunit
MEQGDLSLEESLKHFERGIALARSCQQSLAEAEQKVKILISNQGKEELEPFETEEP